MMIAWIERNPPAEWSAALAALDRDLAAAGHDVSSVPGFGEAPDADAYLVIAPRDEARAAIAEAIADVPDRLRRIVLVGPPLDFAHGSPTADEGTIAGLLERHQLGGVLGAGALLAWQPAPSQFAGPKSLMRGFDTNPMKAFQTDRYANWFATPGTSAGDFLARYLPVLAGAVE
jgi:hypothetical protein